MLSLALAFVAASVSEQPLLHAPAGYAVDLVAQAPEILWPSANLCLDDGSLLVGEDRMDMPGPSDQPLDRLIQLRFRPDGSIEKKVFADKLNAVFGLELVDGAVYVMNMPFLTRLVDHDGDGVADERTQILSDLGHPAPGWPGGFNDHIVSGIRLGHDGWLYVAVGDKGIPHAHGPDGSELTLRGGGVVRVRPDGSQLQLVASGLRNILDVAIDERGEMFTHDNTDDGLGWWTRLTHVVQGGYYGYPWDYHEHTERMLPCMKDYGGGSPTGGLVYREASWPAPYQGSLFFCEWAKQRLRRFEVEPQGASYRVVKDEDFLTPGDVKDFRPTDVCESPDGRFLYVSDWGYGGWTNPAETGRIWRVRRADDDPARASVMQPLPADTAGVIAALGDPSYRRRLRAQRELSSRLRADPALRPQVQALLASGSEDSRRHVLWALAQSDPSALAADFESLERGSAPAQRRELMRVAAAYPHAFARAAAARFGSVSDPVEQRCALAAMAGDWHRTALAEPKDPNAQALLIGVMKLADQRADQDPWVGHLACRLLREIGARPPLWARRSATEVYYDRYDADTVALLAEVTGNSMGKPEDEIRALELLAGLARKPAEWDGKWWGTQPAKSGWPVHTLDWEHTNDVLDAIRAGFVHRRVDVRRAAYEAAARIPDRDAAPLLRERFVAESDPLVRARLLAILGELGDEGCAELLRGVLADRSVAAPLRAAAIESACRVHTSAMLDLLAGIARDPASSGEQAASCVRALGRFHEPQCLEAVGQLVADARPGVGPAAVAALVQQRGADALPVLAEQLRARDSELRKAVLRALRKLAPPGRTAELLAAWRDPATRLDAGLALCARPDAKALEAYLDLAAGADLDGTKSSRVALAAIRDEVRPRVEELARAHSIPPAALEIVRSVYSEPAPLLDWELRGPFARKVEGPDGGQELAWKKVRAREKDGFVDLERALASRTDVAALARTHVTCARARKAEMRAGSDDMLTVWVNGVRVHDHQVDRGWTEDADRFEVQLRAGENEILLRIGQSAGQWSFNAKLSSEGGGPIFEDALPADPQAELRAWVLAQRGNAQRGERVFRESQDKAMCIRCHTVAGVDGGGAVGPELSDVGSKYAREEILSSILEPSRRILDGYQTAWLELDDGRTLFGLVKGEQGGEILLYDTNGLMQRVETSAVEERGTSERSAMPDGLSKLVTREELADLVEWLSTLKSEPK
ncbi:MAG: HEAT repeat domain-containing protein [Planctomycetes bacterium]|nr:HEAT repeat domain-containing protein [Planctomycetota bacterium]